MFASVFMVLAAALVETPPKPFRAPEPVFIEPSSPAPSKIDDATKRRLWSEACRNGSQSFCYGYALMLRAGRGGRRDASGATRLIHNACEHGLPQACRDEQSPSH